MAKVIEERMVMFRGDIGNSGLIRHSVFHARKWSDDKVDGKYWGQASFKSIWNGDYRGLVHDLFNPDKFHDHEWIELYQGGDKGVPCQVFNFWHEGFQTFHYPQSNIIEQDKYGNMTRFDYNKIRLFYKTEYFKLKEEISTLKSEVSTLRKRIYDLEFGDVYKKRETEDSKHMKELRGNLIGDSAFLGFNR